MRTRPRFTEVVDWVEGRLDPADADRVQCAIDSGDERTIATARWVRTFVATAAATPLHEPPPIVRQNLRRGFDAWREAQEILEQSPQRAIATLVFDSRQDLALAGVRSGAEDDEIVHLAFTCEAADVVLDLTPIGDCRMRLEGQVLLAAPDLPSAFEARVVVGTGSQRSVNGDELGRFVFDSVPADTSELVAENADLRVHLSWDRLE